VAFQFEDWPANARKPQVGDVILHESYIGEEVEGEDGRKYRLINDRAVMAVLERAPIDKAQLSAALDDYAQHLNGGVAGGYAANVSRNFPEMV
jgi:hypothetical protein